ncbi:polysaccharide deacetylase family protein [Devosia rhodophyticola]|uniref:Chitooligosaccharide deacetylase n=1 Tax=Devosia rhodophyticola TaxID=3026423 RepID=A0ABY7YYU1_9HYPH|nr:polysaccharide deacetylase family protein [Devosia rhodophyticola]WDR06054.1 polysaccharide deacetylase family protein [Devosia rhodophyticola]
MTQLKYTAISAMFEAIWMARLPGIIRQLSKSRGVIFTLHRVLPDTPAEFSPNSILQVRPDFLEYAIKRVRELGLDIVNLDEAIARLRGPDDGRNFVVFTFDDAYRDNLTYALPILRRHQCPFTLYVPTSLVDGIGEVWWQALEDIIAHQNDMKVMIEGEVEHFDCAAVPQKRATFAALYQHMREMPEMDRIALMRTLANDYGLDLDQHCRDLIMDWQELEIFANEPLCTIGAHTVHHYELAKLPCDQARTEIVQSMDILKAKFDKAPEHFSYPIGGPQSAGEREFELARDIGLKSAVTTRPGGLYAGQANQLHALPRVSLNGLFQSRRYVDVFATGALFSWMGAVSAA